MSVRGLDSVVCEEKTTAAKENLRNSQKDFCALVKILPPTSRCRCVLPGAFDLEEDGVGVIGKQNTSDQTKHLRNNKRLAFKLQWRDFSKYTVKRLHS